jgi:hypothetical protein
MRVREEQQKRPLVRILRRIFTAIALCIVAVPSVAGELVQTLPHLWVSAAALSLALITAASRPKI